MSKRMDEYQSLRAGGKRINKILIALVVVGIGAYFALRLPGQVQLSAMVPGLDPGMTRLECWLTFDFEAPPAGIDPRDVRVVFSSEVLKGEQAFDWAYIAQHDYRPGSGLKLNSDTRADSPPPTGQAIKVRFPLKARMRIENASIRMPLKAEVYWGGQKQDTLESTVSHVYQHQE